MDIKSVLSGVKTFLAGNGVDRDSFRRLDFGVLRTMMMIAAVDGEVSKSEMEEFLKMATDGSIGTGKAFDRLWKASLRSAGYLSMQAKLLEKDELVKEFLAEAECDFVQNVMYENRQERENAFKCLETMAAADGDYSEIERACITALVERVKKAWEDEILLHASVR